MNLIPNRGGVSLNIDFASLALNIKNASNPSGISGGSIVTGDNNFASQGIAVTFTVASACKALVIVNMSSTSSSDWEFHPQIYLDGVKTAESLPAASIGSASNRGIVRSYSTVISLSAGSHTISGGAFFSAGGSWAIPTGSSNITALVLGQVTA